MSRTRRTVASEFIDHGSDSYAFLQDSVVDALVQVVIELGAETWVTRRRMLVLERVMAEHGILAPELVEAYVPTAEDEALWRQERDRMLTSVYAALARPPAPGDQAAERAKSQNPVKRPPLNAAPAGERGLARGASGV